ncbi:MAG: glycosyltransferase family 4 protein [Myxococcota bacterium]
MSEVLFVSKPVDPPWNDSSKNIVRDLAGSLTRYRPRLLVRSGPRSDDVGAALREPVYPEADATGGFVPSMQDRAAVLRRLAVPADESLWHFFFAPNRPTSLAGNVLRSLHRMPTVHTVCSAPPAAVNIRPLLFARRTVVLSRHTEVRVRRAGVPADRLVRIVPPQPMLAPPSNDALRTVRDELGLPAGPLIVYPGDLEFGGGAERALRAFWSLRKSDAHLVLACRRKTARAEGVEADLRRRAQTRSPGRVWFVGETSRIHDLLAAATVVFLPSDSLFAKMDLPLVLLEAMSLAKPVLVLRDTPAAELAEGGALVSGPPPRELAAELQTVLASDKRQRELGEACRRYISDRFSPARVAARYEAVYDELLP